MDSDQYSRLQECLRAHAPLVIAYSGGADSACLLAVAHETLGEKMLGVIADSPSLPRKALADALAVAKQIGAPVEVIRTEEMQDENYVNNPINRCYYCKAELFVKLDQLARERGFAAIAYGENADDAHHFRPGSKAAEEFSVIAPLKQAGIDKAGVREISRRLGLPTAEAPSQPCLSSRIPHGTPVTAQALAMVEQGEEFVRSLGFKVFRVRHMVEDEAGAKFRARVQIAPDEMGNLPAREPLLASGLAAVGYSAVEIDPRATARLLEAMSETDGIPEAFRAHFRRHNREAILLTLITLAAAVLLWTIFYIVVYGLILLVTTSLRGDDARIPPAFLPAFAGCALVLCLLAWIMRKIRPGYFVVDHKSGFETFMDIILVLPRITFEVWGNFSAWQRPTERELRAAWELLQTLGDHGKISIHQLPIEIPRQFLRARVVFLLQLAGLVELRSYSDGLWLVLRGEKARRLARSTVKIDPELPRAAF